MASDKTGIGDRMKGQYEDRARFMLPRRTYTIVRVDGKAFHSFTRGMEKPFDLGLMEVMDKTAQFMCGEMQGAKMAYVQSDEISVLLTDFDTITTDAWFDGNVQKIASISASLATAQFNAVCKWAHHGPALFDARVFTIPDCIEAENYFIWRQQDASRNSIQMAAQANFSHKQLQGKSCSECQEMLFSEKGINWNDYPARCKRGSVIKYDDSFKWTIDDEPPVFTQDRAYLQSLIPEMPQRLAKQEPGEQHTGSGG